MALISVTGFDPSLRNWGIACGQIDTDNLSVHINHIERIKPVVTSGKDIRNNSRDLLKAQQLADRALEIGRESQILFVEVPIGSQSARAMASYGICVGILAALRASGIPFLEVTPTEVKLVATGSKTATKKQMIDWAHEKHPKAPWPTFVRQGKTLITQDSAEHMADAVAAIYAGLRTPEFQRMLPFLKAAA